MNKKMLSAVILSAIASGTAFADVSPISTSAYFGAELGGHVLLGDQVDAQGKSVDIDYWNMVKVGGDVDYKYSNALTFTAGGEARYAIGGYDDFNGKPYADGNTDVERMTIGVKTAFGATTFGQQNGIADDLKSFGDLSMEYGLDSGFDLTKAGSQMLLHKFQTNNLSLGVGYDFDEEAATLGGTYNFGIVKLGALYAHTGEVDGRLESDAATLGAESQFGKIGVGAKVSFFDNTASEVTSYAVSANYALTDKVKFATSFNMSDDSKAAVDGDDQWATIGASYQLNQHVELVTDYKVGSEHDDKLFLRANIDF